MTRGCSDTTTADLGCQTDNSWQRLGAQHDQALHINISISPSTLIQVSFPQAKRDLSIFFPHSRDIRYPNHEVLHPDSARCGTPRWRRHRLARLGTSLRCKTYPARRPSIAQLISSQWNDCMTSYNGTTCSSSSGWECMCTDSTALDSLNTCIATACSNNTGKEGQSRRIFYLCCPLADQVQ